MTRPVDMRVFADGAKALHFRAEPGLYRLSVDFDAAEFDWESVYLTFNIYGNVNERTGPWDFSELDSNRPVAPAYWFELDGRKIGLGYANRLSARQLQDKCYGGQFGFWIREGGEHVLRVQPYRPFNVTWRNVQWQVEPEDRLEPPPPNTSNVIAPLLPDVMPHNRFTDAFLASVELSMQRLAEDPAARNGGGDMAVLAAAYHWQRDPAILARLRAVAQHLLDQPSWSNQPPSRQPREDSYGYNGDMGAATVIWGLAATLGWAFDGLADMADTLLDRIKRQGDIFIDMALLHQGYWGGSLLQDHGICSFAWFTASAYALRHLIPDHAQRWLSFCLPRLRRIMRALPTDGIVPTTSYHRLYMYVDTFSPIHALHRQATGERLLDHPSLRAVPAAALALYCPQAYAFVHPSPNGDLNQLDGGQSFLAWHGHNPHAAWLLGRLLDSGNLKRPRESYEQWHLQHDWLWAMLLDCPPEVSPETVAKTPGSHPEPAEACPIDLSPATPAVRRFEDSGVAVLRARSAIAMVKCGAATSRHAYAHTTSNTDRLTLAPLSGNFVYVHHGRRVLVTAEGGYRMHGGVGNIMLVDNHGQRGDAGMPMSHPDTPYHGEALDRTLDDGVSMNLTPAYEGLDDYRRTLRINADEGLHVLDEVASGSPRMLQWRFQTYACHPWLRQPDGTWRLRVDHYLYQLKVTVRGFVPRVSVQPTETVWGYVNTNGNRTCHHLRVESDQPVSQAVMRFHIQPVTG